MLDNDVLYLLFIVVLLRLLRIHRVGVGFVMEEYLAACVACRLKARLDQISEANVHYWQLQGYMAKVTRALVVLVTAGLASYSWINDSHLGVHQALLVWVTVVFVCVSSLDLY